MTQTIESQTHAPSEDDALQPDEPGRTRQRVSLTRASLLLTLAIAIVGFGLLGAEIGHSTGWTGGYNHGRAVGFNQAYNNLELKCYGNQQLQVPHTMSWDQATQMMFPGYASGEVRQEYLKAAQDATQQLSLQALSQQGALSDGVVGSVKAGTVLVGPQECVVP